MKKKIIPVLLSVLVLVGCTNGSAKVGSSSDALMTVGNTTVTKGQLYNMMKTSGASYYILSAATNIILDAEVPVDDAITTEANTQLDDFKTSTGEYFEMYMSQYYGYDDEETFMKEMILPSIRLKQLYTNYAKENYESLCATYHPVEMGYLTLTDADSASSALADLQGGESLSTLAVTYSSSSDGVAAIVTTQSELPTDVMTWTSTAQDGDTSMITASDGNYYVVQMVTSDPTSNQDAVIDAFLNITSFGETVDQYYFKKYGFKMYDKDLFDAMNKDYPGYAQQ